MNSSEHPDSASEPVRRSATRSLVLELGSRFCFAFTFFSLWEAVLSFHVAQSFRAHVGEVVVRAIFFAAFTFAFRRWFGPRRILPASPTPPLPNNALQRTEAGGGVFSDLDA